MKILISAALAAVSLMAANAASADPRRDDHHPIVHRAIHHRVCTFDRHHHRVCR